jgi:ABC-2 type transport system ATP-binding protein
MEQNAVIEATELSKSYGTFCAVDKLTLNISEGEIFGFLGPNGAGKTTTILMLLGLTEPTAGTIRVLGMDPAREPIKVKSVVGYMPEKIGFYEDLTGRQNLDYTAALNGISRSKASPKIDEVLELVGLAEKGKQRVAEFSHGMKQRLGLADVMIKEPKIAIFDEPTSGIDPEGIEQILAAISVMAQNKTTVLFSSHQLHHVQRICTKVGIMAKGQLKAEGSIDILGRDAMAEGKFRVDVQIAPINDRVINAISRIKGVVHVEQSGEDMLKISCEKDLRNEISRAIIDNDSLLTGMKIEEYSLDKIYMKYMKEQ